MKTVVRKNCRLWRTNPFHPSPHFSFIGDEFAWEWIGAHVDYDKRFGQTPDQLNSAIVVRGAAPVSQPLHEPANQGNPPDPFSGPYSKIAESNDL